MAKKKDEPKETESLGSMMKPKLTQKERNLLLKAKLIEDGELEETPIEKMGTIKERNLYLKQQLSKDDEKE